MEVVHEGVLEIGINPNSKSSKDWKPRLFVIKKYPATGRSSLDFYKSTSKRWQKQSIMGVLSLWPYFEISLAHQCPYKYTLKLSTAESTVYLASSSASSMNKWFYYIQTQRILETSQDTYIYNVQAQDSDSMNLLGVYSDCRLALTPSFEIICALMPSRQVVGVWPLDCLRTFSYGGGVFSFEAGRHAPHGPGEYSFLTQHDHLIHGRLMKLIEKAKRSSWSSSSSSRMDNRPPAQLPIQDRDSSSDSPVSCNNSDNEEFPRRQVDCDTSQSPIRTNTPPPPLPENPPPKIPPKAPSTQEAWLHERFGPHIDNVQRLLQSNAKPSTEDESGDHVYSHTVHPKAASDFKGSNDPQIYNSLVHQGQNKPGHYEMAFPDRKTPLPAEGPSTVVYDTAYTDTDGHHPPIPIAVPVSSLMSTALGEGMTANPLYGSQGNLLEDIMSNQVFDNSPKSGSPPLPPKPKSLSSSPESNKLPKPSHPDITANPVYVASNIRKGSPPPPNSQNHTPPINSHTPPLSQSPKEGLDQNKERNKENKGYSKINKPSPDSLRETFIPGSLESDPPPIPERQCSFNED